MGCGKQALSSMDVRSVGRAIRPGSGRRAILHRAHSHDRWASFDAVDAAFPSIDGQGISPNGSAAAFSTVLAQVRSGSASPEISGRRRCSGARSRDHRLDGFGFRRQTPIGPTSRISFALPGRSLSKRTAGRVEKADARNPRRRERWISARDFRILRFPDELVIGGLPNCVMRAFARRFGSREHRLLLHG